MRLREHSKQSSKDAHSFVGPLEKAINEADRMSDHIQRAGFPLVVALLITGCSSAPAPSTPAAPRTAQPAANATSSKNLKHIDRAALQSLLNTTAKELMLPGAIILLRTPQGDFTLTYGTTQLGATIPPTADTYFRIASNTKTMTAAIIMQLAQENKLSLDDPVSKYLRGVPNGNNITIAQLLDMRSGLYNYSDAPEIWKNMDQHPARVWSPAELLAIAFARKPNYPPDTAYEYNNTNYLLLSLIVEKLTGQPLAEAMRHRLFDPLHLQHTFFPASTVNTLPNPYSHGYLYGSASVAMIGTPPYTPQTQAAARAGTLQPRDFTNLNHSCSAGAGAVVSNADDLATWIQALVTGHVLNADFQRRWLDSPQPQDPNKPEGQQYGLRHLQTSLGTEHNLLPRWRDTRLQLIHGLRSRQPRHPRRLDESNRRA